MIGSAFTFQLEGRERLIVSIRLADAFTAEEALGYDPIELANAASGTDNVNLKLMRGALAVCWAAWRRQYSGDLDLDGFIAAVVAPPERITGEDGGAEVPESRPTVAGAGSE